MGAPQISGGGVLDVKVEGLRRQLDTFELGDSITRGNVTYRSDEVTSNCPITGQPDWYDVTIELQGAPRGIESKSLKLYLQSFREDGQFCEAFAEHIAADAAQATGAARVAVLVVQRPRGGVSIRATAIIAGEREPA